MADPGSDDTLTTAQAAARLGVAPNSVMAWADAGLLLAWRTPGGHRRISAASVQAMLEQRRQRAALTRQRAAKVMLVEDNPDTALVLSSHLTVILPTAQVRTVRNGFEALVLAGREPPDLLISDVNLPGMNGLAMMNSLRSQDATARVRFVIVSNHSRQELGLFGPLPDDVPFLNKPVSPDALREAIEQALGSGSPSP